MQLYEDSNSFIHSFEQLEDQNDNLRQQIIKNETQIANNDAEIQKLTFEVDCQKILIRFFLDQ